MPRSLPLKLALSWSLCLFACTPAIGLRFEPQSPPAALAPAASAPITDHRGRFREIFCALNEDHGGNFRYYRPCEEALHRLGAEPAPTGAPVPPPPGQRRRIVIIPGIFGECVRKIATPFEDGAAHLRRQGYRIDVIRVSGRSSSEANAATIRDWFAENVAPGERVLLLGYSKGMSDIMETLGRYPRSIPSGTAIVSVAGVVWGTPIADRARRGYGGIAWLPLPYCRPGDRGGVASITRRHRTAWLDVHPLPRDMSYYSIAAFAERRRISRLLLASHRQLTRIDARNDGQVIHSDAILPGSYLLGYANADHWAVTLPLAANSALARPFANRNDYPREILLEAIVRTVEEIDPVT